MTRSVIFLAAIAGCLAMIAGCGDVAGGTGSPQTAALQPVAPTPQDQDKKPPVVPLIPATDPGAMALSNFSVSRIDRGNVAFSIDYAFVQGKPIPSWTYGLSVIERRGKDHVNDTWIAPSGLASAGHLSGNLALSDIGNEYVGAMTAVPFVATTRDEFSAALNSVRIVSNGVAAGTGGQGDAQASIAASPAPTKPAPSGGGFLQNLFGGKAASATPPQTAKQSTPTQSPPGENQQASNDPGHIQLDDFSVKITGPNKISYSVAYKFDSGQPNPAVSYFIHLTGSGRSREMKKGYPGVAMKPEGKFEDEVQFWHPAPPYKITVTGWVTKVENAMRHTISNDVISNTATFPATADSSGSSSAKSGQQSKSSGGLRTKADVGVGAAGKDYGNGDGGLITTPVSAYFSAREMIVFKIKLPNAMKMFKALHDGRNPKSQEEFDDQIIKENGIDLPELPEGQKYVYDPAKGELMVEHPKSIPAAR